MKPRMLDAGVTEPDKPMSAGRPVSAVPGAVHGGFARALEETLTLRPLTFLEAIEKARKNGMVTSSLQVDLTRLAGVEANLPDPEFGKKRSCSEFAPPAQRLGAHVASLGMRFYTGSQFPAQYRNQIFIAEHGSWNRSSKVGYRVTLVRLDGDRKPVTYEPFAQGWLQGQRAWGRPADVEVAPDGSLLIADDAAGAIYRVRYRG